MLPSPGGDFHLHPKYRAQLPLEPTLLKTKAGLDEFVTEKYHDQIAAILGEWSTGFLVSPQDVHAVERILAPDFSGASFRPVESRSVRPGSAIEIRQNKFARDPALAKGPFLRELQSTMGTFAVVITAEFQVTSIDAGPRSSSVSNFPSRLLTGVRYELVGSGKDFYREQRVGYWELEWDASAAGEFRLRGWRMSDETQSRSVDPVFADVTARAFAGNASYSSQLLRGAFAAWPGITA